MLCDAASIQILIHHFDSSRIFLVQPYLGMYKKIRYALATHMLFEFYTGSSFLPICDNMLRIAVDGPLCYIRVCVAVWKLGKFLVTVSFLQVLSQFARLVLATISLGN